MWENLKVRMGRKCYHRKEEETVCCSFAKLAVRQSYFMAWVVHLNWLFYLVFPSPFIKILVIKICSCG